MNLEASPHDATRSEPVVCAGGAAGRRQRGGCRPAHASERARHEQDAGADTRNHRRPHFRAVGPPAGAHAARASCTSRSGCAQAPPPAGAGEQVDLELLDARFNVRANDIFIGIHAGRLLDAMQQAMPRATLCFVPEEDDLDDDALRSGRVDLFISASRPLGHEIRVQPLFSIRVVGVAREDHPCSGRDHAAPPGAGYRRLAPGKTRGRSTTRWPAWAWTGMWRWSCPPPAARCWRCKLRPDPAAAGTAGVAGLAHGHEDPRLRAAAGAGRRADHPGLASAPPDGAGASMAAPRDTRADRRRPGRGRARSRAETGRASARRWRRVATTGTTRRMHARRALLACEISTSPRPGASVNFSIAATEERRNMSTAQDTRPQSPAWPGAASRAWTLLQRLDIATPRACCALAAGGGAGAGRRLSAGAGVSLLGRIDRAAGDQSQPGRGDRQGHVALHRHADRHAGRLRADGGGRTDAAAVHPGLRCLAGPVRGGHDGAAPFRASGVVVAGYTIGLATYGAMGHPSAPSNM